MIYTARQIQDLHKNNGHIVLPYRARLTPAAQDWVRSRRLAIGYSDAQAAPGLSPSPGTPGEGRGQGNLRSQESAPLTGTKFLYWCDGPCGPAKAALSAEGRETELANIDIQPEPGALPSVIKHLAKEISTSKSQGGILLVQYGASPMLFANRCSSLRAVLGTCLPAVEQGMQQIAANVLVIEYAYKSLHEMRSMIGRFVKAKRQLSEDLKRQLQELSQCA